MVRPRLRVRSLMVLVAIVALGVWGEQMMRRRAYCLEMAEKHRSQVFRRVFRLASSRSTNLVTATRLTSEAEKPWDTLPHPRGAFHVKQSSTAEGVERLRKGDPHAAWHLNLRDVYLRSASRPWLALPVEPTEPLDFPRPGYPDS